MKMIAILLLALIAQAASVCGSEAPPPSAADEKEPYDFDSKWALHRERPSIKAVAVALDAEGNVECSGWSWGYASKQQAIDRAKSACREAVEFPNAVTPPRLFVLEDEVFLDLTEEAAREAMDRVVLKSERLSGRDVFDTDEEWEEYRAHPPMKAAAVGMKKEGRAGWGTSWGYATAAEAIASAVELCRGSGNFPKDGSDPHVFLLNEVVVIDLSPAERTGFLGRYRSLAVGTPDVKRNSILADTWEKYRKKPPHRVLAVARNEKGNIVCSGWSWGFASMAAARENAFAACRKMKDFEKATSGPEIYAVNGAVVADYTKAALESFLSRFKSPNK